MTELFELILMLVFERAVNMDVGKAVGKFAMNTELTLIKGVADTAKSCSKRSTTSDALSLFDL